MKKNLISILLFVMIMPFMVNAKEYCKVVDGDGKSIGSEIACGSEHFYIIDSNEDEIKMLAKYNLYTGVTIYKEKLEDGQTCAELASSKGGTVKSDDFYYDPGYCFYAIKINDDIMLQNEEAKSAHWDENLHYLYPQVGDNYLGSGIYNSDNVPLEAKEIDTAIEYNDTRFKDFKISKSSMILEKLEKYESTLNNMGYGVSNMDLLSLSEIDRIIYRAKNIRIPLKEWGDSVSSNDLNPTFGVIKDYLPSEFKWLYSTTYWNKTIFCYPGNCPPQSYYNWYYVFVAEQGKICGAGFQACAPQTTLGCGIRPVITIANELEYIIKTETDSKGSIDVVENSLGGETIQFKVSAKKGYKLGSIVIKTDSGEEVEFSEGEITKNDDGTFSINKNKFTMPFENVTIQAKFELENILKNPETGDKVLFIILILVVSIGIGTFIYKKKESRYNI